MWPSEERAAGAGAGSGGVDIGLRDRDRDGDGVKSFWFRFVFFGKFCERQMAVKVKDEPAWKCFFFSFKQNGVT